MVHSRLSRSPVELLLWALRRRVRTRVAGPSMAPTLRPGDHVLVDLGAYRRSGPAPGDVVLASHPHTGAAIIKRVAEVLGDGRIELRGDNPDLSTDSRDYGPVRPESVRGRVVARFP